MRKSTNFQPEDSRVLFGRGSDRTSLFFGISFTLKPKWTPRGPSSSPCKTRRPPRRHSFPFLKGRGPCEQNGGRAREYLTELAIIMGTASRGDRGGGGRGRRGQGEGAGGGGRGKAWFVWPLAIGAPHFLDAAAPPRAPSAYPGHARRGLLRLYGAEPPTSLPGAPPPRRSTPTCNVSEPASQPAKTTDRPTALPRAPDRA